MEKLHITTHTGKLFGIRSLSTSTLLNPFCQSHPTPVCDFCYARQLETFRTTLHSALARNTEILSCQLPDAMLPRFQPGEYVRFNSFGELFNAHHLENLLRICALNPETHFALWTKRIEFFPRSRPLSEKPSNLTLVYSWGPLNPREEWLVPLQAQYSWFDHVFAVYTKDPPAGINCSLSCSTCLMCYHPEAPFVIRERLRHTSSKRSSP